MNLEELKEKFIVDDELQNERLARLAEKALGHCVVHKNGSVELSDSRLSGKDQVRLVLSARLIASKLDTSLSDEVTVEQIAEYTGLPKNQAAARAKECLDGRIARKEPPEVVIRPGLLRSRNFSMAFRGQKPRRANYERSRDHFRPKAGRRSGC